MLPSTGRFRGINCPFFNSGLCERPYCHFRHVRNEIEDGLGDKIATCASSGQSSDNIVHLVSETVRKLLPALHTDGSPAVDETAVPPEIPSLVSRVLDELKPESSNPPPAAPSYKPTPIAELKKAHIPISYKATCLQPQYRTIETKSSKTAVYSSFTKSSKKKLEYTPFRPGIEDTVIPGLDTLSPESDLSRTKNSKKKLEYTPFRPGIECRFPPVVNGSSTFAEVDSYEPTCLNKLENDHLQLQFNAVKSNVPELEDDESSEVGFSPVSEDESEKVEENESHEVSGDEVDLETSKSICSKIEVNSGAKVCDSVTEKQPEIESIDTRDGQILKCESIKCESIKCEKDDKKPEKVKSSSSDGKETHLNEAKKVSKSRSTSKSGNCEDGKGHEKKKHSESRAHSKSSHGHKHGKTSKEHSVHEKKHRSNHSKHSSTEVKTNSKSVSKSRSSSTSKSSSHRSRHSDSKHRSTSSRHNSKHLKHSSNKSTDKKSKDSSSNRKHKSEKSKILLNDTQEDDETDVILCDKSEDGSDSCIVIQDSPSESDESITEECLRIFQEYEPQANTVSRKKRARELDDIEDTTVPSKKRVAHPGAKEATVSRPALPAPKRPVNPAQALLDRFAKVREAMCEKNEIEPSKMAKIESGSTSMKCPNSLGRVRIAPVSNVISLMAKPKAPFRSVVASRLNSRGSCDSKEPASATEDSADEMAGESSFGTVAQTVSKGSQRVAHKPSQEIIFQPSVKDGALSGVVPLQTRQKYLKCLFDEYKKHVSLNDACEKAASEEHATFSKCTVRTLYFNRMAALVQRIRHEAKCTSSVAENHNKVSHADILAGKTKGSWSVKKTHKHSENEVKKSMYEILSKYVLTDEELKTNGFPRYHPTEKSVVTVQPMRKPATCADPLERICCRCGVRYQVNKHGLAVRDEHCTYHPGRRIKLKLNGMWDTRYACCKTEDSVGCCTAGCHVSETYDPDNLTGFVHTLPKEEEPPDGDHGVFALDCEMVYTTSGLELARVTVIDSELNTIYESLVKPENVVLDCNSRFSGIQMSDLDDVKTSILEVQAVLLGLFSDKTILIGHSLDSDLKALKLVHDTVVDTSVLFPHRLGPPYKRSLKNLAQEILRKVIQEDVGGHDSAEDAVAAMELARWRVQEDLRAS
ncbi:RNA exonuclease 1 homolog [Bacillus rossius redtenbacheri]|uniref:RNA exonuclease 1 homolog n=1 Tax=Bacillus rossius redtenbacheri TaxID=93214 RepID=UPI002FDD87EC